MTFDVHFLGVGDTFSDRHHPTSLLLECGGFLLGIDCPDMYRRVLRDAGEAKLRDIDHLLITHVHGDHMNGLEGVGFFKHFAQKKRLQLIASPDVRDVIWDKRLEGSMGQLWDGEALKTMRFDDYFAYTPLPWGEPIEVGPFRISSRRTKHHVPTSALRIEAEGRILGYSADTAFDVDLIRWLSDANLIVHETNLGPSHSLYSHLRTLPEELREKMVLVHYPDGFESTKANIHIACEGDTMSVPQRG